MQPKQASGATTPPLRRHYATTTPPLRRRLGTPVRAGIKNVIPSGFELRAAKKTLSETVLPSAWAACGLTLIAKLIITIRYTTISSILTLDILRVIFILL
jgi:hypothetical protein